MTPITKQDLLIPPDLTRCQVDVPNGDSFMTIGGKLGGRVRCSNVPRYIVYEIVAGDDGRFGSMSMCQSCIEKFTEMFGNKVETNYRIEKIAHE